MFGGGGELVVRYGTLMVGRVMVIAAVVASAVRKKWLAPSCTYSLARLARQHGANRSTVRS